MVKERNLIDIGLTASVGLTALCGGIEVFSHTLNLIERTAESSEKYFGSVGSEIIEKGVPTAVALSFLYIVGLAVKATDDYLLNK